MKTTNVFPAGGVATTTTTVEVGRNRKSYNYYLTHLNLGSLFDGADGSDEKECVPRNCSESEYRCGDGRCIRYNTSNCLNFNIVSAYNVA